MPDLSRTHPAVYAPWSASWRAVVLLVVGVAAARLLYLAFMCPYTLVEDEAFYWEWSRRLAASYYSKGPGIAWTIAVATSIIGDTEFAVRFFAPIFAAGCGLLLASLAREASGEPRAGFFAAACLGLAPMFQVAGLLMTIDGPYAFCYALSCWAAWRAFARSSRAAWLLLGVALGIGFLYKYTILLLVPGLALFAFFNRRRLRTARHAWAWMLGAAGIFVACCAPVAWWNSLHGWPTIAHLLGHLGVKGGDIPVTQGKDGWNYTPMWTIDFIGSQLAMIGPVLLLACIGAWREVRHQTVVAAEDQTDGAESVTGGGRGLNGGAFLLWCGAPVLVFYLLVSFVTEPEGNWALGAYLPACCLAGITVVRGMDDWKGRVLAWRAVPSDRRPRAGFFRRQPETAVQVLWHAAVVIGLLMAVLASRLDLVSGALEVARKVPLAGKIIPAKAYIPVGRFMGADRMGKDAATILETLRRETGKEPFIVAMHYGRAAQLAFYTKYADGSRPLVVSSSSLMTQGRRTQYDYWPETDLRTRADLIGRPALAVGWPTPDPWQEVFERVSPRGKLQGDGKRDRLAYVATGFLGFPGTPIVVPRNERDP